MDSEIQFKRLTELFEREQLLSPELQSEFLDLECAGQHELRKWVDLLLARHKAWGVLDDPLSMKLVQDNGIPSRIGQYEIIDVLGRGGMGIVFRAFQCSPDRMVAIKILRTGLDLTNHRQQFEFETAVLARLQHPSIATIFEIGACDDGEGPRPYFAIELIEELTLDQYIL